MINPDGSKKEIVPEPEKKEEAQPTFKADFNTPGWMKLEINLEAVSHSLQAQWQLIGFMDDHKSRAMQIITAIIQQRNQVKAALHQTQSKNGFRGFLDKLRK